MSVAAAPALDLARRLIGEAVWQDDACTWIGPLDEPGTVGPLGPDLYSGTAGIALFLGAAVAGGVEDARPAAIGAARHALDADHGPGGLFSGTMGAGFAAVATGRLVGDASIEEAGLAVASQALAAEPVGHDLMDGMAGLVMAGTALGLDERTIGARAATIATSAHTGLGHGAAGHGLALIEAGLLDRARDRFEYERSLFDADVGNWPDLRDADGRLAAGTPPTFMTAWCHGATGIALSRIRAWERLGEERWVHEARAGLATVSAHVEAGLVSGHADPCLCHGMAGHAEVLAEAARVLPEPDLAWSDLAAAVAEDPWLHRRMGEPGRPLGLMAGLCGVGLFQLRHCGVRAPSPLIWRPLGEVL